MTDTHKTIQYNLRITEELRERLKKSADFHNRSMNADIVARLEQTFTTQTIAPVGIATQIPIKNSKRYIFTEWRYTESYDPNARLEHNEKARMAGCAFLTRFFKDHPEHQFVKLENITSLDNKGREVLDGLRIWYTY